MTSAEREARAEATRSFRLSVSHEMALAVLHGFDRGVEYARGVEREKLNGVRIAAYQDGMAEGHRAAVAEIVEWLEQPRSGAEYDPWVYRAAAEIVREFSPAAPPEKEGK